MPLFKKSADQDQRKKIYSEEEIKKRLESMTPDMQNTFIRMAETLLHKESEMFLGIVAQSRQDIMDVGSSIKEEQDMLKSTAKFLARERRGEAADGEEDEEAEKTRIHFETEHNKRAVQEYLRAVGREVPGQSGELQKRRNYRLKNGAQFIPEYARKVGTVSPERRPTTASSMGAGSSFGGGGGGSSSRPSTAYRMRMQRLESEQTADLGIAAGESAHSRPASAIREVQQAPPVDEKVKEEQEELMEHMKRMDTALQGERERQQEAIQARKEARKAKKEAKKADEQTQVKELMETNQEAEEKKRKSKERQEQVLKERLAKKKLERRKTLQDIELDDANPQSSETAEDRANELEHDLGITRAKTNVEPEVTKKKGAKKKQKQQQEEAAPAPKEADWGIGDSAADAEPKKTKKKKKGEAAAEAPPAAAGGEEKVEKKKKKKKEAAPDTVLDLEEPPAEEKKKKKKKKLDSLDMSVSEV